MKMRKVLTMVAALALTAALAIGGTLAYLTAKTVPITNTFTVGNIKINLTETWNTDTNNDETNDAWSAKLIPGNSYAKDPTVTVEANSEACWLFLHVDPNISWDSYITYTLDTAWKSVDGHTGYYYQEVDATTAKAGQTYNVLGGNTVSVKTDAVTQDVMDDITAGTTDAPAITFTAAAVQSANVNTVAEAWAQLPAAFTT